MEMLANVDGVWDTLDVVMIRVHTPILWNSTAPPYH